MQTLMCDYVLLHYSLKTSVLILPHFRALSFDFYFCDFKNRKHQVCTWPWGIWDYISTLRLGGPVFIGLSSCTRPGDAKKFAFLGYFKIQ